MAGAVQLQFIFNFRLFSYIRVHFLGQNLEWSGFTHVVLISQLKVFLKNNLVMTVIKRVFYDLFGSVTTSSWLFYTSWQVKIFYFIVIMTIGDSKGYLSYLISRFYLCCCLLVSWTDPTYKVTTKAESGNVLNVTPIIIQHEQDSEQLNPKNYSGYFLV